MLLFQTTFSYDRGLRLKAANCFKSLLLSLHFFFKILFQILEIPVEPGITREKKSSGFLISLAKLMPPIGDWQSSGMCEDLKIKLLPKPAFKQNNTGLN